MLKVGDIVELFPPTQRNRQLRKQNGKWEWEIIKIDPSTICFNNQEGILIQSVLDRKHDRWVQREDVQISEFRENRKDVY